MDELAEFEKDARKSGAIMDNLMILPPWSSPAERRVLG
jgi:hypothetical protein